NLNSFRFLEQAINYEVQWQVNTLENGGTIQQATVLFDPDKGETRMMRTKEEAHDYRYFPDPDLLPLDISEEWKDQVHATLPELPHVKQARYVDEFGLSAYDASILTASREMAEFFDATRMHLDTENDIDNPKLCANWIIGEVAAQLNRDELDITQCPITAPRLSELLAYVAKGRISNSSAKEVFRTMWTEGGDADSIIYKKALEQISDTGAIESLVDEIIAANADKVAEYRSGKDKLFGFFVGLAMKASKGKANPAQLNDILKRKLAG
ncbi:MAG: Asp-tRNA(Asn)/Glu-tRNA(Gln) amidotransferase GatCAB subunit B, partial [Nitrosomonadales bacterium]|nr:Asp-tRNA(Asn)/Glu-tRNA(Gln) amidotransferase GatCAB subunit B [Nitrosomonadales bacterium]